MEVDDIGTTTSGPTRVPATGPATESATASASASARVPPLNARTAQVFDDIADLLEIGGHDPYRARAYRTAARELRSLTRDVGQMLARHEDLARLRGIGAHLAERIAEIAQTGRCETLDQLHQTLPESLHALLRVPGLGPRRVRALLEQLDVRSVADLDAAVREQRVRALPGFGARSEHKLAEALAGVLGSGRRLPLGAARREAARLVERLREARGVHHVVVAGSYRRGRATVGDLDVLVTARGEAGPEHDAIATLVRDPEVSRVLAEGPTRATVVLRSGLQVDLRLVDDAAFGAALHYFTGSKAHNVEVRTLARRRGLKLSEYGVFRGEQAIAGRTEASVFEAVDLPFIPPELREHRGEIEAARAGTLPTLVTVGDLRGNLVRVAPRERLEVVLAAAHRRQPGWLVVAHAWGRHVSGESLTTRLDEAAAWAREHAVEIHQAVEVEADASPLDPALRERVELVIARLTGNARGDPPRSSTVRRLVAQRPHALRVVLRDLGPIDEPSGELGRLVAPALAPGMVLVVDDDGEGQLAAIEPLLRWASAQGVAALLGGGDPTGSPHALELAVLQARRAWIEAPQLVNARAWSRDAWPA